MRNKTLSKVMAVFMMSAVLLGSASVADAKSAPTDFGIMTYSLKKTTTDDAKKVVAKTTMPVDSKVYSYVKTTLEVQINSTGSKILEGSILSPYEKNTEITAKVTSKNYSGVILAAFSCHEVVGKTSTEQYLADTF